MTVWVLVLEIRNLHAQFSGKYKHDQAVVSFEDMFLNQW